MQYTKFKHRLNEAYVRYEMNKRPFLLMMVMKIISEWNFTRPATGIRAQQNYQE